MGLTYKCCGEKRKHNIIPKANVRPLASPSFRPLRVHYPGVPSLCGLPRYGAWPAHVARNKLLALAKRCVPYSN